MPIKPNIQKGNTKYGTPTIGAQPPLKIIPNPPAKSVAQALANSQKAVNAAK
jgi:hypothetical protein